MQTFLPYASFEESAKCLDNRRLGKQRVECLQILNVLKEGGTTKRCSNCRKIYSYHNLMECPYCKDNHFHLIKTPWYNHPATQQWKGHEWDLFDYLVAICDEWRNRGYKDSVQDKAEDVITSFYDNNSQISWLGNEEFHASHRSNLLRKDPVYYGKFGWNESNDLPYLWPSKIKNL